MPLGLGAGHPADSTPRAVGRGSRIPNDRTIPVCKGALVDSKNLQFGKGQSEAKMTLGPPR